MTNQIASENPTIPAITLASQGVRIEQTMTTPKRPGKKPRPVWVVSGNTSGLEAFFRDIGGKKFRGAWSFFSNPTNEISERLETCGRGSCAEEIEGLLETNATKAAQQMQRSAQTWPPKKANSAASMIPMGQPIFVGHHSDRHHCRDLDRIDSGIRKSVEEAVNSLGRPPVLHENVSSTRFEYALDFRKNLRRIFHGTKGPGRHHLID